MSLSEIVSLRAQCEELQLEGREVLAHYLNAELAHIYNGAGPDSWQDEVRAALTDLMHLFKPVILIHDAQFHESDGTVAGFDYATRCWETNCHILFNDKYPLLTLKMLERSYRCERLYWYGVMTAGNLAVGSSKGLEAWREAYQKRSKVNA